jgi:predicted outer membrane repeat protein
VEVYDSTFESNTASEYGGAIMIGTASVDSGTLTIYDSTFQSNSAGER